jgi:hypothetical protein
MGGQGMAQWYVLYTKMNCHLSQKTRELLQVMGCDYFEEVLSDNDEWETPVVFLEEDIIGDYKSLQNHFKRKIKNGKTAKKKYKQSAKPTTTAKPTAIFTDSLKRAST